MSEQRTITRLTDSTKSEAELRKEFRSKVSRVVSRGFVLDRLSVALPDNLYGEWIPDDPVSIAQAKALGFEINNDYGDAALHKDAAGNTKIGDTVFMTMQKWMKEEIDILKQEEVEKHHAVKKAGGKPSEELQYEAGLAKETPVINESKLSNKELSAMIEG